MPAVLVVRLMANLTLNWQRGAYCGVMIAGWCWRWGLSISYASPQSYQKPYHQWEWSLGHFGIFRALVHPHPVPLTTPATVKIVPFFLFPQIGAYHPVIPKASCMPVVRQLSLWVDNLFACHCLRDRRCTCGFDWRPWQRSFRPNYSFHWANWGPVTHVLGPKTTTQTSRVRKQLVKYCKESCIATTSIIATQNTAGNHRTCTWSRNS